MRVMRDLAVLLDVPKGTHDGTSSKHLKSVQKTEPLDSPSTTNHDILTCFPACCEIRTPQIKAKDLF